jgi:replicative DNA helicase
MLESKEAIANVIELVKAEDFYKPAHTEIYETILELYGRGERPDAITVAEELNRRGTLDSIGGKPYIHGLLEAYPTASSAAGYARIVEEHSLLRRLIEAGNEVADLGFSMPEDVAEAVDKAEEVVYQVGDRRLRDDVMPIRPLLTENMEAIEQLYERGEHLTGLASGFEALDEKTLGFQPSNLIIIAARPSMGKCIEGTSSVVDPATGDRIAIRDFVAMRCNATVSLDHAGHLRAAGVTDWIPNGYKECFEVRTRTGRKLKATGNHPLLTATGWMPIEELRIGARIAIPRRLDVFGGDGSWAPERARLLGYYIAEGGLTGRTAIFTNTDAAIAADFVGGVAQEFPDTGLRSERAAHWYARHADHLRRQPGPNSVTRWLAKLGLMGKSALQKRFPDCVWRFTRPLMREFLKALFSCDGTIYSMGGYARIEFTVASEGLAEDVQHALLRFGIVSKLWRKTERSWRVEITEPDSVDRYQLEIGWIGEKAQRGFLTSAKPRRSNIGHLPPEAWDLVKKSAKNAGMSLSEMARRAGEARPGECMNLHTKRGLPRRRLARYAEVLNDDDLRWLASEDLYWDEIVSIEPIGEHDVYDLTVPDGHNFVADDIIVHNSALLGDFALHSAVRQRSPVVIFSLEMSRNEIVQRFLSSEAKVDSQRIRKGSLQEQDWARLSNALGRLHEAPIFIDDSASISLMEMRAKCRRLKAKFGLGLIIIDYLQLMQSPRRSENRNQEVSEISRSLKILARELEVPVLCASQLNRGVESRSDKRPMLGDLRESGAIEQDADMVMFLYRDEFYNQETEHKGEAELIIAKHRNGPTGMIHLAFMNQYTKFASIARGTPG